MRLFRSTNIDFLGLTKACITGSLALIALATVLLFAKGLNWGVDFTGGAQVVYAFSAKPDEGQIRKIVEGAKVPITSVQRYDKVEKNQVLLRVPMEKKEGRDISSEVSKALTTTLFPKGLEAGVFDLNLNGADGLAKKLQQADPEKMSARADANPVIEYERIAEAIISARSEKGLFHSIDEAAATPGLSPAVSEWLKSSTVAGPFTLISTESVGPQVGKDLRKKGLLAVLFSWAAMLAYIAFRFRSASFGTAAVVALIHDSWITLGLCSLFGVEISLTVVAAFLTLIGYSVNDTVVVYDRIRENLQKPKKEPLALLVNRSINETLSRTVITSGLTFLVVLSLFFLGGEVLRPFAFVLLAGIIVGTYSSIFIAAPLVIVWENWRSKKAASSPAAAPAAKGGKPAPAKSR
ncbi:MAG: protein translocase subunit SecF [Holophagales bacterium]|nr:protein translocase subunit SecF [Holophagales bacterium]